jgi:hypothetical protein
LKSRIAFFFAAALILQAQSDHDGMTDINAASVFQMNLASGTSVNPTSAPAPMLMRHYGNWNTMFMGQAFLVETQQSGPRGGDKLYAPNEFMTSLEHRAGPQAAFEAELMLSLEPATVTDRRYPLLFQTGETAFGRPIVDAQHPHNFVMALGFHYTRRLSNGAILDLYAAPVGDPALGPVAFPHRASASELPQAPISHHLQDSTHIAGDVITLGLSRKHFKIEASGFHGAEPGENRWTIEAGAIDSWSARAWFTPTPRWTAQISAGHLTRPERPEPGDQTRITSSLSYRRLSLIWGRTHNTVTRQNLNSYLAEGVLPIHHANFLTARLELVDKDELSTPGTFRIGAATAGYTRNLPRFRDLETGLGANITAYKVPSALTPSYGDHPIGANIFLRIRLRNASN